MSKRGSKYVCMFLIYMIILPVFHSANVFAEFFGDIHGYDNVPDFRRQSGDITIINVSALIDSETIMPWQVKLISDPTRAFECTEGNLSQRILCEMRVPGELPPGPHLYEVQLFRSDSSEAEPKIPLTIYVDNLAPTIHTFELQRNGSSIDAVYAASDRACDTCAPDICAGIDRIEFLLNYEKVGEVVMEGGPCLAMINHTNLSIPPAPGTATKNICMDVYDRLQQKSSECMDITMDFSPPQLINASLWLGSSRLKYTKGEPITNAKLQAYIYEDSVLNLSSIVADFAELNSRPEWSGFYRNIDMNRAVADPFYVNCSNISADTYSCTWSGLLLLIPSGASPEVNISAYDSLGNLMNASYSIPIVFDNTRPMITAVRSGIADERGRYWVGKGNNTLYVDITETDSGFNDKKLYLDVSSFGRQPWYDNNVVMAPSNCTEGWVCVYGFVNVLNSHNSGDLLPLSFSVGSVDDANNPVDGVTTAGVYFDGDAPQIVSIQNSSICPAAPDSIDITINVSERYSGGVKGEVSAPLLSSDFFPQPFGCEETETTGLWTCDIKINNLVTFYSDGEINITLMDRAGNTNSTTLKQEVCEAAPGTPPNVVKTVSSVNLFPAEGIDRKVAGMIPYPVFWQPNPKFDSGTGSIQDIKVDSCAVVGGEVSDARIVTPLNFENPLFGFKLTLPIVNLSVANTSATTDSVQVSCQLSMIVRAGNKVYQQPEIEIVEFEVPLHDTMFGELNKTMDDRMDEILQMISDKEGEIDSLQGWIDFAGWYCSISEYAVKIVQALQALKIVLYAVGWAVWLVMAAFGQSDAGMTTGGNIYGWPCLIIDLVSTGVITLLWQTDPSQIIWSPGYFNKILCTFFTCRLTESTKIGELLGFAGRTDAGQFSGQVDGVNREGSRNTFSRDDMGGGGPDAGDAWLTVVWAGDNKFSAYRSLPIAQKTLCGPAILYAKKKERQIMCMYRNCFRDLVGAGFAPDICDRMYQGRECLYVDGAVARLAGHAAASKWIGGLINEAITELVGWGVGEGLRALNCPYPVSVQNLEYTLLDAADRCGSDAETALTEGWEAIVYCGAPIAINLWLDIGDWVNWDDARNMYDASLGDPDFCEL